MLKNLMEKAFGKKDVQPKEKEVVNEVDNMAKMKFNALFEKYFGKKKQANIDTRREIANKYALVVKDLFKERGITEIDYKWSGEIYTLSGIHIDIDVTSIIYNEEEDDVYLHYHRICPIYGYIESDISFADFNNGIEDYMEKSPNSTIEKITDEVITKICQLGTEKSFKIKVYDVKFDVTIPSSVAYTVNQLGEYIKNNEDGIRKIVYENKDKILDNMIKQISDSHKRVLYESDEE